MKPGAGSRGRGCFGSCDRPRLPLSPDLDGMLGERLWRYYISPSLSLESAAGYGSLFRCACHMSRSRTSGFAVCVFLALLGSLDLLQTQGRPPGASELHPEATGAQVLAQTRPVLVTGVGLCSSTLRFAVLPDMRAHLRAALTLLPAYRAACHGIGSREI